MTSQIPHPSVKQQSIARKPLARKDLTDAAIHNQQVRPIGNVMFAGAPTPSPPSNISYELQGSPVPSLSDTDQAAGLSCNVANDGVGLAPPPDMAGLEASGHAIGIATNTPTLSNKQGGIKRKPAQGSVLQTEGGTGVASELPSSTTQSQTNHDRRMQRRTMMMSVTANFGTNQSQSTSHQRAVSSSLAERTSGMTHSLSPAPSYEAEWPSCSDYSSPTQTLAQMQCSTPPQASRHAAPRPMYEMSARQPLSLSPPAWPSAQTQRPASSNGSSPQTMSSALLTKPLTSILATSSPQLNLGGVQYPNHPHHPVAELPEANDELSTQNVPRLSSPSSAAQSVYQAQRTTSIASAQTPSTVNSLQSGPKSPSSIASPMTCVTTSSTLGSPLSQNSEPLRISPGTSFFECLVCASGNTETFFCIYCYTTGAAAGGHPHDPSYYICAADPLSPDASLPPYTWTVHKNAMNRLWYQHNASKYKTYVRPMSVVVSGLPAGWEERHNSEGRPYYFHAGTGKSSWIKPGSRLPSGWKEMKTPDGVSFYFHEEFQLSTWHRPGQQPSPSRTPLLKQQPTQREPVATNGKKADRSMTNQRASIIASGVGIAASWSASGMDVASDPVVGTTKAVTKGVIVAAKSLKNNTKARKMLSRVGMKSMKEIDEAAINATDDIDEVGQDKDEEEDNEDQGDDVVGDEHGCGEDGRSGGLEEGNNKAIEGSYDRNEGGNVYGSNGLNEISNGYPQQEMPLIPGLVESQTQPVYMDPLMPQGSCTDLCGPVPNLSDCFQGAAPLINDIAAVENNETGNHCIVQSSDRQMINESANIYLDERGGDQHINQSNQDCVDHGIGNQVIDQSNQANPS